MSKKDAVFGLRALLADGEIQALGAAAEVLVIDGLASAKPGLVDRLIHGGYVEAGGTMASFEKATGKLESVRVL